MSLTLAQLIRNRLFWKSYRASVKSSRSAKHGKHRKPIRPPNPFAARTLRFRRIHNLA